jgi:hypothetical protein
VIDYGVLADRISGSVQAGSPARKRLARNGIDPAAFYESVKAHVEWEVRKANEELRKRQLSTIERIFVPSFLGRLSLTFGTALLCSVELNESKGRVRAVIFGPPNHGEIARKDFFLIPEALALQYSPTDEPQKAAVGYSPDRIAAEIVSGFMTGKFA